MAEIGKHGAVLTGTASSETDITSYVTDSDLSREFGEVDTTAFGATTDETSLPTTNKSEFKVSFNWDATIEGIMRPLLGVAGKSTIYAPLGTGTGSPKITIPGYWKSLPLKTSAKGKISGDGVFVKSGAIVYGTY